MLGFLRQFSVNLSLITIEILYCDDLTEKDLYNQLQSKIINLKSTNFW